MNDYLQEILNVHISARFLELSKKRFKVFYNRKKKLNLSNISTFFKQVFTNLFPLFIWFKDKDKFNDWLNLKNAQNNPEETPKVNLRVLPIKKSNEEMTEIKEIDDEENYSESSGEFNSKQTFGSNVPKLQKKSDFLGQFKSRFNRQASRGSLRVGSQFDLINIQKTKKVLFKNRNQERILYNTQGRFQSRAVNNSIQVSQMLTQGPVFIAENRRKLHTEDAESVPVQTGQGLLANAAVHFDAGVPVQLLLHARAQ